MLSTEFTVILPILFDATNTDQGGTNMRAVSIGIAGTAYFAVILNSDTGGGDSRFWLAVKTSGGADLHKVYVGDEDGTNWLSQNKWYQLAFSGDSSGIQYVVNGDSTPTETVVTDSPGAFNWTAGSDRMWVGASAAHNAATPATLTSSWCSHISGPTAIHNQKIDLTDTAVLARIFDDNGDLKNPGADGSLWFGDTYGATPPSVYMHDGTPRLDYGAWGGTWTELSGDGSAHGMPGGLRKEYE
jgi:hypothetical protein